MRSVGIAQLDAEEKAGIYRFLARVLSTHPTPDSVWGLCQMAVALDVARLPEIDISALDQEYTELFVVPSPRYVAACESVFRQGEGCGPGLADPGAQSGNQLTQQAATCELTRDVEEYYREAGLPSVKELPDHIGNELRFMAYLWWRQARAVPAEVPKLAELRERFRRRHLLEWIGRVREAVAERDRLGYYHNAFKVAEAIIEDDE